MIEPNLEVERKYASASRALEQVGLIISGDQDAERDDQVTLFFSAVYSMLEYVEVACNRYDKRHGGTTAKSWRENEFKRPLLTLFRKIRDVDQHLFVARILHRMTFSVGGTATITARISWRNILRNGFRMDRTLRDFLWDPRMTWLRKLTTRFRQYRRAAAVPNTSRDYSWGLSAADHNASVQKNKRLTPAEMTLVDSDTAADLFAQILGDVRNVIDECKIRGFFR